MVEGVAIQLHAVRSSVPARRFVARLDPELSRSLLHPSTADALGLRTHRCLEPVSIAGRVRAVPVGVVLVTIDGELTEPLTVGVCAELTAEAAAVLGRDWLERGR